MCKVWLVKPQSSQVSCEQFGADEYLKNHAQYHYQYVAPMPAIRVANYSNATTGTDMHYPLPEDLSNKAPVGDGKAWTLPGDMTDRNNVLTLKEDSKYPLRSSWFTNADKDVILTNHFEYELSADKFYEYKILDMGTKNRKKLKVLMQNAINSWPFLNSNQASFATNGMDTIVSWIPLHTDLKDGEAVDDHSIEWGSHRIPLGNDFVSTRFKFVKAIDTHGLRRYAAADPNYEHYNFNDIATCLNIVISKSFSTDVHKLSSNKFFVKRARSTLNNGTTENDSNSLEIIRGYYYNVKPGMGNIILNFNISTSAVFRPILVSEFMADSETFAADRRAHILAGKTVYIHKDRIDSDKDKEARLNDESSRYWKIFELQNDGGNIDSLVFYKKVLDDNGKPRTNDKGGYILEQQPTKVVDHLEQVFSTQPRKDLVAVNVGSRLHPVWYAQEFLRIVPYQPYTRPVPDPYTSSMVDQACRDPAVSRAYIEKEGLASIGFTTNDSAVAFGANIPVKLIPTMLQVPHHILGMPAVKYSNDTTTGTIQAKKQSHWHFPPNATRFLYTNQSNLGSFKYAILLGEGVFKSKRQTFKTRITSQIAKCGFQVSQAMDVSNPGLDEPLRTMELGSIKEKLEEAKKLGADLVVLVLQSYNVAAYRNFKSLTDRDLGMQSVCMTLKRGREDEITTNIMMKVNLKFGGINHGVTMGAQLSATMVIGADLIHPGPGSYPGTPSIAAVVGSVDLYAGKCLGSLRLQDVHKTDREIIDEKSLKEMVLERLMAWKEFGLGVVNELPNNIIYFRDGVSVGHYDKVKEIEHRAIRAAYKEARSQRNLPEQELKLVSVIVTKRHHTRFFPQKPEEGDRWGNKNTHPGTCVDKLVTSPYYQDFFLQSHSGIKGTAKPTHYFVLENEIELCKLEGLRDLIHNLCYSYVRTMGGVSYVSPTYYADRLCERGRLYIRKYFIGDDKSLWDDFGAEKKRQEDIWRDARAKIHGTGERKKSSKERQAEKDDSEKVMTHMKDWMLKKVENEFYVFKDHADESKRWDNPYSKDLAQTMFWM
ncbi:uncharacterized protein J4E92_001332 [Alternaria infectoria]|uniref:uncharacterized protein n=1 Tax=Alternaria infectoria TaxID=45303 RepID=UPI002220C545|nr:uncharacterized protein J4E92_001332 [Alternaria infectoria]KAI4940044.1 hypothetical protein J4E92_001332 [Alternaria infectoria]